MTWAGHDLTRAEITDSAMPDWPKSAQHSSVRPNVCS